MGLVVTTNRYVEAFARSRYIVRLPELRPHQLAALDVLADLDQGHWARTAPTGTGKTLEMVTLTMWNIAVKRRPVVIVVPTLLLLDQVLGAFRRHTSLAPGIDQGGRAAVPGEAVILTTAQTYWRRCQAGKYSTAATILFDEVHGANAVDSFGDEENRNLTAVRKFEDVKGFSASPWSPWCLSALEQKCLYLRSAALKDGNACAFNIVRVIPDPCAQLGKSIWFCDTIEGAKQVQAAGGRVRAGLLTGPDREHVDQVVRSFHAGQLDRVICVGRGTVGFDTNAESVVIDRDLGSPVLAVQMAGRLRPLYGKTVYVREGALDALLEGLGLADGAPIRCNAPLRGGGVCGATTHLTAHHRGPG